MHVIMGVVNKLPINLNRAWVEYAVQIEQQTGERAKFLDLSKLEHLMSMSIPRWMGLHTNLGSENYQLHYFVDASKHATLMTISIVT